MIAVGFPGQGGQKIGMTKELPAEAFQLFEEASAVLGYDLLDLCNHGPAEKLNDTQFAQPALLVTCYAIWNRVKTEITADFFVGHSLGEITALLAAEALTFSDAVKLVAKRGEIMSQTPVEGGMYAILGMEVAQVEELCQAAAAYGTISIANYNSPGQIVVSGENQALEYISAQARELGAKRVVPLAVSGPFHSPLMKPAAEKYGKFLAEINFKDPVKPVVSNHRNVLITTAQELKSELVEQLISPVRWIDNIELLGASGVKELKEIAPSSVLIGLTKRISETLSLTLIS